MNLWKNEVNNLKRIKYEGKWYKVDEEEFDHYHLKGVDVSIRKNEIKNGESLYSKKKQIEDINKSVKNLVSFLDALLDKLDDKLINKR